MNAVWCLGAMRHFGELLAEAHGWPLYVECPLGDGYDTVHIIGMYDAPDYDFTLDCTKKAKRRVISWCGSDVQALTRPEMLPEAVHLCETEGIQRELREQGIEAAIVPFPTRIHAPVTPLVDAPTISFYAGSNPHKYGMSVVRYLMDCIPEARWHIYSLGQHSEQQMEQVIANTRVHVRFTKHDGAAASVREHLEAGRRVVTTADIPFAKRVSIADPVGIVRAVRAALKAPLDTEAAEHYKAYNSTERFLAQWKEAVE